MVQANPGLPYSPTAEAAIGLISISPVEVNPRPPPQPQAVRHQMRLVQRTRVLRVFPRTLFIRGSTDP
jgi:hypothetical protein